ncbi:MAG: creatininase family protein, partial [Candidatus Jordarchaeaceae archaeon]
MSSRVIPYENLTWVELDSLDRDKTVILVAVAPMEQHGHHLPLGTDFFECITIMEGVGEGLKEKVSDFNVLRYPPLPVGTGTMDKTGTVEFRQETVKNIIYELGQSLAIYGFKHIIVFGCHGAPTFAVAIEEACEELNQQYGDIIFPPMGYCLSQIFVSRSQDAPEEIR